MAIRYFAIPAVIILMVILSEPKRAGLADARGRFCPFFRQFAYEAFGNGFLFRIGDENFRPVLVPDIRSLTVNLGKIMNLEEQFAQLLILGFLGVVRDLDYFGVACVRPAYIPVRRLVQVSPHVSDPGEDDSWFALEPVFNAPKTPCREVRLFQFGFLFLWNKKKGDRVDAMPDVFISQPLTRKHVAKMPAARGARDFRPPPVRIRRPAHRPGNFIVKRGPAAP